MRVHRDSKVSEHFTFGELTTTEHRAYLDFQANPPVDVLLNLHWLARDLLEKARAKVGPLIVSSGYRCAPLNMAIGGSLTSAHLLGLAADVIPMQMGLRDAFMILREAEDIPWDQIIFEFGRWIHIGGTRRRTPRREALVIFTPGRYEPYRPEDSRIV